MLKGLFGMGLCSMLFLRYWMFGFGVCFCVCLIVQGERLRFVIVQFCWVSQWVLCFRLQLRFRVVRLLLDGSSFCCVQFIRQVLGRFEVSGCFGWLNICFQGFCVLCWVRFELLLNSLLRVLSSFFNVVMCMGQFICGFCCCVVCLCVVDFVYDLSFVC